MLNVSKEQTKVKKKADPIRAFFELEASAQQAFSPAKLLHNGFVLLSSADAGKLLAACRYERQVRDLTAGGKKHASVLADIMKRGAWRAKDKLDFALVNGKYVIVNGHHRLTAQAISGVTIEWTVVIHDCSNMEAVADLYYSFDTNLRIRSRQNILSATGIAEEMDLPATALSALYLAIPLIEANFDFSRAVRDPIIERVIDRRLERMRGLRKETAEFDAAIEGAPHRLKKRLRQQGPMSVALMAFRHQPDAAAEFWSGIAENDGLRRGDPRHTYLRFLNAEIGVGKKSGSAEDSARAAATAWNAFFEGRQITFIKTTSGPLRIAGTPIRGQ